MKCEENKSRNYYYVFPNLTEEEKGTGTPTIIIIKYPYYSFSNKQLKETDDCFEIFERLGMYVFETKI